MTTKPQRYRSYLAPNSINSPSLSEALQRPKTVIPIWAEDYAYFLELKVLTWEISKGHVASEDVVKKIRALVSKQTVSKL